jgi:hypothetical protein
VPEKVTLIGSVEFIEHGDPGFQMRDTIPNGSQQFAQDIAHGVLPLQINRYRFNIGCLCGRRQTALRAIVF